jgi:hypothetical protein
MRVRINPHTIKPDYYGAAPDEIIDAKTESLIEVRNDGIAMSRAQLGYASNVQGHRVIIKPALASVAGQAAGTLGFTTTALNTNENGFVINFGVLEDVATNVDSEGNSLSVGDIIYLSASVAGGFTKNPPSSPFRRRVGSIMEVHNNQGKILVELPAAAALAELLDAGSQTNFDTGFEDPDNVGSTYDRATRTVTLTHSSGTIAWFYRGARYTTASPWTSAAHANTTGAWFLTINGATTAQAWSLTPWAFTDVMAASANYDSASADNTFALRESHGTMPWQDHLEFHDTVGTYWKSGLGITAGTTVVYTPTTAPTSVDDNTPGIDIGVIKDEDLSTTIPALTQGTYTTAYRNGASGDWVFNVAATTPYFVATNTLRYNQFTGATWQLSDVTEDGFVNVFDFAIPVTSDAGSQKYRHIWITGQVIHDTLAAAQAEQPSALSLGTLQSLFAEATCVNRFTYQFNAIGLGAVGAGVSGRCKIMSQDPIRGTARNQVAIIGSTPVLSVLPATNITVDATGFDGNLAPTDDTVQKALQKFDDYTPAAPTASTTSVTSAGFRGNLASTDDTVQKALERIDALYQDLRVSEANRTTSMWYAKQTVANVAANAICWSPEMGLFMAVAPAGTNRAHYSPDGAVWTGHSITANAWNAVCWSAELGIFCAVASSGTLNRAATTTSTFTWVTRTTPEDNSWRGVCWSPELSLFCAVAADGTNRVMTSPTGVTWTSRSLTVGAWRSVCWSPSLGLFCAVSFNVTDTNVATSPDGINWTIQTAPNGFWGSVCWSPKLNLFVAVSDPNDGSAGRIMTSSNGIDWSLNAYINETATNQFGAVCWSDFLGVFCIAAAYSATNTGRILISHDGINWIEKSAPYATSWRGVAWSTENGCFAAVAATGGNPYVMTSARVDLFKQKVVNY